MRGRLRLAGVGLGVVALTLLMLWPMSSGPSANATTRQVMMMGNAFSPASLTIAVGDRVTWVNHDEVPHDATTTNAPASFRSPMLEQGDTWMHQFTKAGTYDYYCSIHPGMRAKIVASEPEQPEPPRPTATKRKTTAPKPEPTSRAPAPPEPDEGDQPSSRRTRSTQRGPTPTATAVAAPRTPAPTAARQVAPPATGSPATTTSDVAAAPAAATWTSLNPLLLVAGLVTAVLVFALLVLSSRPN